MIDEKRFNLRGFIENNRVAGWAGLLLVDPDSKARFWDYSSSSMRSSSEVRVIEQDVIRTRQEDEYYGDQRTINNMKQALISYCAFYNCEYMQGLNEIIAVFLCIDQIEDESNYKNSTSICYSLFEKFIERIMPAIFSTEGVDALQLQLCYFHQLFSYHLPDLWCYLENEGMTIDIYATAWFVTLFARRSPVNIVLYLWDLILQNNRPHLILFIGLAFLSWHDALLRSIDKEYLPETLVRLNLQTYQDVHEIFLLALGFEANTPASIISDINKLCFDSTLVQVVRKQALEIAIQQKDNPCLLVGADDVAQVLMSHCSKSKSLEIQTPPSPPPVTASHPVEISLVAETVLPASPARETSAYEAEVGAVELGPSESSPASPSIPLKGFSTNICRYLLMDCRTPEYRRYFVEGSVSIPLSTARELCRLVLGGRRQLGKTGKALFESLGTGTLPAGPAAVLALVRACEAEDTHYVLIGDDSADAISSPVMDAFNKRVGGVERRVALALILLGFPRVSVIRGESLSIVPSPLPYILTVYPKDRKHPLLGDSDGGAALVYRLWKKGAEISTEGVIHVPEDAVLARQARQFTARIYENNSSPIRQKLFLSMGGVGETFAESIILPSLMELTGGLSQGLEESTNFLKNMISWGGEKGGAAARDISRTRITSSNQSFSPPINKKSIPVSISKASTLEKDVVDKLHYHSTQQSIECGKIFCSKVQDCTSMISSIERDLTELQLRFLSLRSKLEYSSKSLDKTTSLISASTTLSISSSTNSNA